MTQRSTRWASLRYALGAQGMRQMSARPTRSENERLRRVVSPKRKVLFERDGERSGRREKLPDFRQVSISAFSFLCTTWTDSCLFFFLPKIRNSTRFERLQAAAADFTAGRTWPINFASETGPKFIWDKVCFDQHLLDIQPVLNQLSVPTLHRDPRECLSNSEGHKNVRKWQRRGG